MKLKLVNLGHLGTLPVVRNAWSPIIKEICDFDEALPLISQEGKNYLNTKQGKHDEGVYSYKNSTYHFHEGYMSDIKNHGMPIRVGQGWKEYVCMYYEEGDYVVGKKIPYFNEFKVGDILQCGTKEEFLRGDADFLINSAVSFLNPNWAGINSGVGAIPLDDDDNPIPYDLERWGEFAQKILQQKYNQV